MFEQMMRLADLKVVGDDDVGVAVAFAPPPVHHSRHLHTPTFPTPTFAHARGWPSNCARGMVLPDHRAGRVGWLIGMHTLARCHVEPKMVLQGAKRTSMGPRARARARAAGAGAHTSTSATAAARCSGRALSTWLTYAIGLERDCGVATRPGVALDLVIVGGDDFLGGDELNCEGPHAPTCTQATRRQVRSSSTKTRWPDAAWQGARQPSTNAGRCTAPSTTKSTHLSTDQRRSSTSACACARARTGTPDRTAGRRTRA